MIDGIAVVFGNTAKFFDKVIIIDDLLFIIAIYDDADLSIGIGISADNFGHSAILCDVLQFFISLIGISS